MCRCQWNNVQFDCCQVWLQIAQLLVSLWVVLVTILVLERHKKNERRYVGLSPRLSFSLLSKSRFLRRALSAASLSQKLCSPLFQHPAQDSRGKPNSALLWEHETDVFRPCSIRRISDIDHEITWGNAHTSFLCRSKSYLKDSIPCINLAINSFRGMASLIRVSWYDEITNNDRIINGTILKLPSTYPTRATSGPVTFRWVVWKKWVFASGLS